MTQPSKGDSTPDGSAVDDSLPDGELRDRAVRNGMWAMFSLFGNRGVSFLTVALLSRLLFEEYGAVASLMTVLFFVEVGLDLGLGAAVIYEQEEGQSNRIDVAFTANLGVAAILGLGVFLAAPALGRFFHVEEYDDMFRLLAVVVLVRGLFQIPDALLKRDLRWASRTAVAYSRSIARLVVAVGLAAAGAGVMAAAWGLVAAEVVAATGALLMARYRPTIRVDWPVMKSMLTFAGAILAVRFASQVALNGDYLVVGNQLGDTDLGFYFNAFRLPQLAIMSVYLAFSDVAFPVFARARVVGMSKLQTGMVSGLELLCLYGFPAGLGLAVNAASAARVVFGPGWEPSIEPMIALSLAAGIIAIGFVSGDIYVATGRPGLLLALIVAHIPIQFALLFVGTNWGISGVAWAQLLSLASALIVRMVVAGRVIDVPISRQLRSTIPGLVAAFGVLVTALPVSLALDPGLASLILSTTAGVLGATLIVRVFVPATFAAVVAMVGRVVRRVA